MPESELWKPYAGFHAAMVSSKDVDPVYPVYRNLVQGLRREQAVCLVLLHVAYYHMGSALRAFFGCRGLWDVRSAPVDLPVAVERRGHRSQVALKKHLEDISRNADRILYWTSDPHPDPYMAWDWLTNRLMTVHGNGRWAAFKTAEMLKEVCDVPVRAPDMGHAHSSGPRKGLELLYSGLPTGNSAQDVRELDRASLDLVHRLRDLGLDATIETAETTLCDFHSLVSGRYYVGHDIDQMQMQLDSVPGSYTTMAYAARNETLPHAYLGERNGWTGVDAVRKRHFKAAGEVLVR